MAAKKEIQFSAELLDLKTGTFKFSKAWMILNQIPKDCTYITGKFKQSEFDKEPRSLQQNRFLFGVIYKAIRTNHVATQGSDISIDRIHQYCKNHPDIWKWDKEIEYDFYGSTKVEIKSPTTTKLSMSEFTEYIESIIIHFAQEYFLDWKVFLNDDRMGADEDKFLSETSKSFAR